MGSYVPKFEANAGRLCGEQVKHCNALHCIAVVEGD